MIAAVGIIARMSWQENLRSRFLALAAIFGGAMIYLSLLLGLLAADQELRVLLDSGLGLIELTGSLAAVYGAATVLIKEMETKTIYLVLTRPVGRGTYLAGKFLGLVFSAWAVVFLMAGLHLILLFAKGWSWSGPYLLALTGVCLKILVIASLATFLALLSTSTLSSLTITAIAWTLGHLLPEIRFLITHRTQWLASSLKALSYLLPDLQLFNFRDRLDRVAQAGPEAGLLHSFAYAACYSLVWLALSRWLLRRKEL